ncbi:hypothetical protein C8J57DRAFT_1233164 [Mycena rebaudengoi]|nr:hypothetical protein C8J57DRAFT_1233164 [Mycena rebaudengoi]
MDDCDVPVDVVVAHVTSATSAIADNFAVADDGSIMRAGNAEMSDAEEDAVLPTVLGCGQRKKFGARRYNGPVDITVTGPKSVQFTRPRYALFEQLVEIVQYPQPDTLESWDQQGSWLLGFLSGVYTTLAAVKYYLAGLLRPSLSDILDVLHLPSLSSNIIGPTMPRRSAQFSASPTVLLWQSDIQGSPTFPQRTILLTLPPNAAATLVPRGFEPTRTFLHILPVKKPRRANVTIIANISYTLVQLSIIFISDKKSSENSESDPSSDFLRHTVARKEHDLSGKRLSCASSRIPC